MNAKISQKDIFTLTFISRIKPVYIILMLQKYILSLVVIISYSRSFVEGS